MTKQPADQNVEMEDRRRLEIFAVAAIVVITAFYARAEYVPTWSDRHLAEAADTWGLPVENAGPWFSAWTLGDGQAFAIIASDPLGLEFGQVLRDPGYRFARAGYSWLTWMVTAGQHQLIPYGLAVVGGLALLATLVTAIVLRERLGPSAWFIVLNPALYLGFAGDTTEPLAILLLSIALASNSPWAGAAVGVTRPDYLLATMGKWKAMSGGVIAAVVIGLYALWKFGVDSLLPDVDLITLPFGGYITHPSIAGWLLAALALVTAAIGVRHRNWTWVAAGLFVICFAPVVIEDPVNAWRAAGMLPVLWAFGPRPEQAQRSAVSDVSSLPASA